MSERSKEGLRQLADQYVRQLEAELAEIRRKLAEMHGARLTWADRALKAEQKIIDMRRTHVKVWEECPDCPTNGDSDCLTCIDGLVLADGVERHRVCVKWGEWWRPDESHEGIRKCERNEHGRHPDCRWVYDIPARLIEGDT